MRITACLLVLLVIGCSASGRMYEYVATEMPALKPGTARLTIFRVSEFTGSAAIADVSLDGLFGGKLRQNGFIYYDIPAGKHELSLRLSGQIFGEPMPSSVSFEAGDRAELYLMVAAPDVGQSMRTVKNPDIGVWGKDSQILELKVNQVFNIRPVIASMAKQKIKTYRQDY